MEKKKLCRSKTDIKIAGVCGGLAEYIGMDANIIRIIWAVLCLGYGAGALIYLVCALILPKAE